MTELKQLVKTCKFCDCLRENLIRDHILLGIADTATRKILLQRKNLKLETAIDISRSSEVTASQMQVIGDDPAIHSVEKSHGRKQRTKSPRRQPERENLIKCKFCRKTHRRTTEECPAYGKMCKKCGKENHFAICCKKGSMNKKEIYNVESEASAENQIESKTESVNHRHQTI